MAEDFWFTVGLSMCGTMSSHPEFDWNKLPELTLDETAPLGAQQGANTSHLLAGAVAPCWSTSLLFCVRKSRIPLASAKSEETGGDTRIELGRPRFTDLTVTITLNPGSKQTARAACRTELVEDNRIITRGARHGIPVSAMVWTPARGPRHRDRPD